MDKKVWYKIMDVLVAALVLGIASIWYPLFQSYQFMQINPDSYLWEASRGAVLRG